MSAKPAEALLGVIERSDYPCKEHAINFYTLFQLLEHNFEPIDLSVERDLEIVTCEIKMWLSEHETEEIWFFVKVDDGQNPIQTILKAITDEQGEFYLLYESVEVTLEKLENQAGKLIVKRKKTY